MIKSIKISNTIYNFYGYKYGVVVQFNGIIIHYNNMRDAIRSVKYEI